MLAMKETKAVFIEFFSIVHTLRPFYSTELCFLRQYSALHAIVKTKLKELLWNTESWLVYQLNDIETDTIQQITSDGSPCFVLNFISSIIRLEQSEQETFTSSRQIYLQIELLICIM